jgi:phospholipid/cholesterol/gamma-HCH transport system ATP-binding protein
VIVERRMIVDTVEGIVANRHPWIREYFHGPRARAAGQVKAGHRGT